MLRNRVFIGAKSRNFSRLQPATTTTTTPAQQRQVVNNEEQRLKMAMNRSNYRIVLFLAAGVILTGFIIVLVLSLTLSAGTGAGAGGGRFFIPAPPVDSGTTQTEPSTSTITTVTTTSTTTTAAATTLPPIAISITCPPDISIVYGKPFDQGTIANAFGRGPGSFVNATGGCSELTIEVIDTTVGTISKKKRSMHLQGQQQQQQQQSKEAKYISRNVNMRALHYFASSYKVGPVSLKKRSLRPKTPSFPNNTAHVFEESQFTIPDTSAQNADPEMAVSSNYAVWVVKNTQGTLVTVTDAADVSLILLTFTLASLAPAGDCDQGSATDRSSVVYDQFLDRWVLLERSATVENNVCIYVSDSNNPVTASWTLFHVSFPFAVNYPQLSVWGKFYAFTYDASASNATSPHCVLDKDTLDALCTSIGYENLDGFATTGQIWTPLHMEGSLPSSLVEDLETGTGGAVFVRPVDDELHLGAITSAFDLIEFIHYSGVNFTTSTITQLRYVVSVSDFDSTDFDRRTQLIMPRATFRYMPECNERASLVMTHTSSDGIRWYELNFGMVMGIVDRFVLVQQGRIDDTSLFLPAIGISPNGTIAFVYSDDTTTYLTTRAMDDPNGLMRTPQALAQGTSHAYSNYGRALSVASNEQRQFYVTSLANDWTFSGHKIKVMGEIVQRLFIATDECGEIATCTEIIRLE